MNIARGKRASIAATKARTSLRMSSRYSNSGLPRRARCRACFGGATAAIIPATLTKERSSARDGIAGATRRCSVSLPGERLIVDGGWHESFTRVFVEPKIDQLPISSTHSINLSARRHLRHLGVIAISLVNDHVGAASVADYSRVIRRDCDYAINSSARCTSGFAEFAR